MSWFMLVSIVAIPVALVAVLVVCIDRHERVMALIARWQWAVTGCLALGACGDAWRRWDAGETGMAALFAAVALLFLWWAVRDARHARRLRSET